MLRHELKIVLFTLFIFCVPAQAQERGNGFEVITEREALENIVPASFYFAGLSGNTQRRNSSAARLGENRWIVSGLVDVSGYSTEISGVYEGFFITDSPVRFGKKKLRIGAYGFGFAANGTANLFDLSGKKILSVKTTKDTEMRRPRPLMMVPGEKGVRFYKGRDYVLVRPR